MKKILALLMALLVVLSSLAFLSGCSNDENTITVYNWGEYISSGIDGTMDVNAEFTKKTGIKVNYREFATNEELYAKLKSGGSSYDVIIPSDYMIGRLIEEDLLEKLNFDNIPNYQYIGEDYKNLPYDPANEYSVPYTWGTVGIFYNTTMVDPEDVENMSWDILWNEKYAGNILMFDNPRDAFAIALKKLGYSMNTTDENEIKEAFEELKIQKPLVQAYVMDQIFDKMGGGEAAIAPYYAGDGIVMIEENPDIAYAVPNEGTNRFVDAMCIVKGSKKKEMAEAYINFLCETEVAVANAEAIGYSTPHTDALLQLDPEILENPAFYPDADVLSKAEVLLTLPYETNKLLDRLWIDLKK